MMNLAHASVADDDLENEIAGEPLEKSDDSEGAGLERFVHGDPPTSAELGIDVSDLPPARAALARVQTWVSQKRADLKRLEDGRAAYLDSIGVPAVTQERIRALAESDAIGILEFMRAGGTALTKPQARSFERAKLEEKLKDDHHAADVARTAMKMAEDEIRTVERELEALEQRRQVFVRAAVEELADGLAAEYRRQVGILKDQLLNLAGAANVLWGHETVTARLPTYALRSLRGHEMNISVAGPEIFKAAMPWREISKVWAADARAMPVKKQVAAALKSQDYEEPISEPLATHLQEAVDRICASAELYGWEEARLVVASEIADLRAASATDPEVFSEADLPTLIEAVIHDFGSAESKHRVHARLMYFSQSSKHRTAAAVWFADHPDDEIPEDLDLIEALA